MKKICSLRKTAAVFLSFALLIFSLFSCTEQKSAVSLMEDFVSAYGIRKTVFSSSLKEGEDGFVSEGFLEKLYGDIGESVYEFAVVFTSDLRSLGECSVFVCHTAYDALTVSEAATDRIQMIRKLSVEGDTSSLEDAFVLRKGKVVVMCALDDNGRARSLWERAT